MPSKLYKPLIAIVGQSGTGKSSSLRNLNKETTYILDAEKKGMPFSAKDFKHIIPVGNLQEFNDAVKTAKADKLCSCLVVDSFTKILEYVKDYALNFKNYEIWTEYAKTIKKVVLNNLKNTQFPVVFTAIDEILKLPNADGSESMTRRIWVQGRELEGKIELEMLCTLYTDVHRPDKMKPTIYRFLTNSDGVASAKSPMRMKLPMYTETNDVAEVLRIERETE